MLDEVYPKIQIDLVKHALDWASNHLNLF
jgi:hypothetical protein